MGVRGLETFMKREHLFRRINIADEVAKWKSENPGQMPIIVIDFQSFALNHEAPEYHLICGGGHHFHSWMTILEALNATGCKLVLFEDLIIQETKIDQWLRRRNKETTDEIAAYDLMTEDNAAFLSSIGADHTANSITSSSILMPKLCDPGEFGDFHYSVKNECDAEIAQHAKRHNALAVITSDTDFLIYDGSYKCWSANEIQIMESSENTGENEVWTIEFNCNDLKRSLSLSQHHLPLFATLLTNDFTHEYFDQLIDFYKRLGSFKYRVENVARYVRNGSTSLSDLDIRRLTQHAFGKADAKIQSLIRQSIDSYNVDSMESIINDPLEQKLLHLENDMYKFYMLYMAPVQYLLFQFYDMRGCKPDANITLLLIDWQKRKIGILKKRFQDDTITFKVLAKKDFNEDYLAHTEKPIYPDFEVPPLDRLYLTSEAEDDSKMIEDRWKILGFIMSLPANVVAKIRRLPKDYMLICTVILALVKERLLDVDEADGILYTEYKIYSLEEWDTKCPTVIAPRFVRAAQIYSTTFDEVSGNFAMAGLLRYVDCELRFEGVYYQKLMQKNSK